MNNSEKLKEIRKKLGLSQQKLADELQVNYSTISRIEREKFNPSYALIKKINEFCEKNNIEIEGSKNQILKLRTVNTSNLYEDVLAVIKESSFTAKSTINYLLIERNFLIGKRISEELFYCDGEDYGKKIINELSKKLVEKYGDGFSTRNLYYFIDFYNKFPNFLNNINLNYILSWSHYRVLLQVESDIARNWYEKECLSEFWSVRTLQRNISSQYYERILSSNDKNAVYNEMVDLNKKNELNKLDYIKDPFVLEFLGIAEDNLYLENDIESSIISNIQKFIMELGKGYAFVARQKRIHTEKEEYFIDLVFYNYILKCFVLIDLKTSKITHQDVGQMDMYIRMYDELIKGKTDNPTIGIVLCSDTDEDIAKYSVMHGNEQLFASKYKLFLPSEAELRKEIERQKQIQLLKEGK